MLFSPISHFNEVKKKTIEPLRKKTLEVPAPTIYTNSPDFNLTIIKE